MSNHLITWLADELKVIAQSADIDVSYKKTISVCPYITEEDRMSIMETTEPSDKQTKLKLSIKRQLNGSFENFDVNKWIVHTWGGIPRFDVDSAEGKDRIKDFRNALEQGELSPSLYSTISSLSKIASFVNPDNYFVYDSRVAFSIDGLILCYLEEFPEEEIFFFPIPHANSKFPRDERMTKLILERYPKANFVEQKDAYVEYNTLIQGISAAMDIHPSFRVEMLLFHIGRTNGEIDKMFFGEKLINARPQASAPETHTPTLENPSDVVERYADKWQISCEIPEKIKKRKGLACTSIKIEGTDCYLFVGEDSKKSFCEVIPVSHKDHLPAIQGLFQMEKKGGATPYFIKEYKTLDMTEACEFMEKILNEYK